VNPRDCFLQGDRFGGALDGAAKMFSEAYDSGTIPMEFVNNMRKQGKLILGIGHRIKSVSGQFSCLYSCVNFAVHRRRDVP